MIKKCIFALLLATAGVAQEKKPVDSNAASKKGFGKKVRGSKGVVIRVAINDEGQEDIANAKLRLHTKGSKVKNSSDISKAWRDSERTDKQKTVKTNDIVDSSTCGWWRYQNHSYQTYWVPEYTTYHTYTPVYYDYGVAYTYQYTNYYTVGSYRYYYYDLKTSLLEHLWEKKLRLIDALTY